MFVLVLIATGTLFLPVNRLEAAQLRAGVAKVDITNMDAGPPNDRLHVRALVLQDNSEKYAIITVDAVAIGEIGHIHNDYLPKVRSYLKRELQIAPNHVAVNASHCHGVVCSDIAERTCKAVQMAEGSMVPVRAGAGLGHEHRIMENRRLKLNDGSEADVRHAYSLPPDEDVADVGPIDPEIGVLRLDTMDGQVLAVLFNFACHPIQGVPNHRNTADLTGFACNVIEENLDNDTIALFMQGCAGDINPVHYKHVNHPRDAEPLGNLLGLSVLRASRSISTKAGTKFVWLDKRIELPLADFASRISALEAQQEKLLGSLRGTSLNLKTFMPLAVKYGLSPEFPSYSSHAYLQEDKIETDAWRQLDLENQRNMDQYIQNVHTMEQLTRVRTNLDLLRMHQADYADHKSKTIDVELVCLRIGDFCLLTFPGEPSVEIGLNIKNQSPHDLTFVAGYTNGYIYYAPTKEQLQNKGSAQEDCDCILAPQWQSVFEQSALELLKKI